MVEGRGGGWFSFCCWFWWRGFRHRVPSIGEVIRLYAFVLSFCEVWRGGEGRGGRRPSLGCPLLSRLRRSSRSSEIGPSSIHPALSTGSVSELSEFDSDSYRDLERLLLFIAFSVIFGRVRLVMEVFVAAAFFLFTFGFFGGPEHEIGLWAPESEPDSQGPSQLVLSRPSRSDKPPSDGGDDGDGGGDGEEGLFVLKSGSESDGPWQLIRSLPEDGNGERGRSGRGTFLVGVFSLVLVAFGVGVIVGIGRTVAAGLIQ